MPFTNLLHTLGKAMWLFPIRTARWILTILCTYHRQGGTRREGERGLRP